MRARAHVPYRDYCSVPRIDGTSFDRYPSRRLVVVVVVVVVIVV